MKSLSHISSAHKPDRHRMTFVLSTIKALEEETQSELAFIRKRLNELSKNNALPQKLSSYSYIYSSIIKETDNESVEE